MCIRDSMRSWNSTSFPRRNSFCSFMNPHQKQRAVPERPKGDSRPFSKKADAKGLPHPESEENRERIEKRNQGAFSGPEPPRGRKPAFLEGPRRPPEYFPFY